MPEGHLIFGKEQCPKSDGWKVPMYKGKLPVVDKQGVRLNQQGVGDMDSLALTNPCICIASGGALPYSMEVPS